MDTHWTEVAYALPVGDRLVRSMGNMSSWKPHKEVSCHCAPAQVISCDKSWPQKSIPSSSRQTWVQSTLAHISVYLLSIQIQTPASAEIMHVWLIQSHTVHLPYVDFSKARKNKSKQKESLQTYPKVSQVPFLTDKQWCLLTFQKDPGDDDNAETLTWV